MMNDEKRRQRMTATTTMILRQKSGCANEKPILRREKHVRLPPPQAHGMAGTTMEHANLNDDEKNWLKRCVNGLWYVFLVVVIALKYS